MRLVFADVAIKLRFLIARSSVFRVLFHFFKNFTSKTYSRECQSVELALADLKEKFGEQFFAKVVPGAEKTVVVVGWSAFHQIFLESLMISSFKRAGYNVLVLSTKTPIVKKLYKFFAGVTVSSIHDYCPTPSILKARAVAGTFLNEKDLLKLSYRDVFIGKFVVSSWMRRRRKGTFVICGERDQKDILKMLAASISFVDGAYALLEQTCPQALLVVDRGYSPYGELFEAFLAQNIPAITWNVGHKSNTIVLKRYNQRNKTEHFSSLSEETWRLIKKSGFNKKLAKEIQDELDFSYRSKEWYSEVGTQSLTEKISSVDIRKALRLTTEKPIVCIFPHIFWDATFFWGKDLFGSYEDWLAEVLRTAAKNQNVYWIIKIHPANLIKNHRDQCHSKASELFLIESLFERLPDNFRVIGPETNISTYDLLQVIDYCLTVRGTVGLESSLTKKRVLTAGTGRYDKRGFTLDFDDRDSYLNAVSQIEKMPKMTDREWENAIMYAHGVFVKRPLKLTDYQFKYLPDAQASLSVEIQPKFECRNCLDLTDVAKIAAWLQNEEEDFLVDR